MTNTVICKDVYGKESIVNADDLEQRIGVYAVIVKDNRILLTQQWGGYSLVGGGVDKGESLEDAFIREVKEETGLDATPGKLIYHTVTYFKKDEASKPRQSFQFYFTQESVEGEINNTGITQSENGYTNDVAEWVNLNEASNIELRHSVDIKTILTEYENLLSTIK